MGHGEQSELLRPRAIFLSLLETTWLHTAEEFFAQILSGARISATCVAARTFHESNSIHTEEEERGSRSFKAFTSSCAPFEYDLWPFIVLIKMCSLASPIKMCSLLSPLCSFGCDLWPFIVGCE